MAAWVFGLSGTLLTLAVGRMGLDWSLPSLAKAILASNLAGFIGLLITLWTERRSWLPPWLRRGGPWGTLRSWGILSAIYFGLLTLMIPELRAPRPLLYLSPGLILCCWAMVPFFGPLQDRMVRRDQQKTPSPVIPN